MMQARTMIKRWQIWILMVSIISINCSPKYDNNKQGIPPHYVGKVINAMTDIMVHDVTNPPLAARFFAYACLAGYEVMSFKDSTLMPMQGVLNQYPRFEHPISTEEDPQLTSVLAMIITAQKIQPSGYLLDSLKNEILDSCAVWGYSPAELLYSNQYATEISRQMLEYVRADKYSEMSQFQRYTPSKELGSWYPTPPGYFPPVEPYFHTLRPFTLDSATQFQPTGLIPFSEDLQSPFMAAVREVYEVAGTAEEKAIAAFWDCNPFALQESGHLMVGLKKISPGAHWMGIANIACQKEKLDFKQTLLVNTYLAVGMMDAFLSCWQAKYSSDRIRPETVIRQYLDPQWKPFLQTPPFPEYTSGHSVVSTTSAHILTTYFGADFSFDDDVEVRFGLPIRHFTSFMEASAEAAISRLYGGIHYMDAIVDGQQQGLEIGKYVVDKLQITRQ